MALTMGEKIKVVMKRRGMTLGELAKATGQTRQNLSNKMGRDNFQEKDLQALAQALNCDYEAHLIMRDTGEKI